MMAQIIPSIRRLSWFGWKACHFLVPANSSTAIERSGGQGRPPGRRGTRLALDVRQPDRTLAGTGTMALAWRFHGGITAISLAAFLAGGALLPATAIAGDTREEVAVIDRAIEEASARFGLSTALIRAVLAAESGGRRDALSPKGAMGLMQLMPSTGRDMRAELGLGDDPFEPRDNILAGARYLRSLYDRFGSSGYLAAYNAGPGRYHRHLRGAPLPRETVVYVSRVRTRLAERTPAPNNTSDWRRAGLFAGDAIMAVGHAETNTIFVPADQSQRP